MKTIFLAVGKLVLGTAICLLVSSAVNSVCHYTVAKANQLKDDIYDALPKKEVLKKPMGLEDAIEHAANTHNVDPIILRVISEKESNHGNTRSLYRFEPGLYSRLRAQKMYKSLSDSEVRMLASSHGVFHILGATAERQCQLHFSQLYNVEMSAMCAAKIVKSLESELPQTLGSKRIREVFKRYNGSGPAAESYANDAMMKLAALLYKGSRG